MLGHWRIALKQAEDAARAGRLDEALALATRPDIADQRAMARLRDRLAADFVARATRRGAADDLLGAVADLRHAESLSASPDALAAARLALAEGLIGEVRGLLDVGDPDRAAERVDALNRDKIGSPALRRLRELAEAWRVARSEARRGEFARAEEALDRADRLAQAPAPPPLAEARRALESARRVAAPAAERLYGALGRSEWAEALGAADALLAVVPEHPAARAARARAWRQIAAIPPAAAAPPAGLDGSRAAALGLADASPVAAALAASIAVAASPTPVATAPAPSPGPPEPPPSPRFLLWVDAVGGYLVAQGDSVVLGRAGADASADVPILGDLARRHARITRDADGSGYRIAAIRETFVNGRAVAEAPLVDGDLIRLGASVEVEFRRPSPFSATARLRLVSRHRLPLAVDGVILMAETCIIGSNRQAHVAAPGLDGPVVLYRQGDELACRGPGTFEVDGRPKAGRSPLTPRSAVAGDRFSFSLEPLDPARPAAPAPGIAPAPRGPDRHQFSV